MLEPGALVAGKYRITSKLGEGGMGVVYEALHTRLQQRVALKLLLPTLAAQAELVARFEREARAAATIDSPNVAKVMDVDVMSDGVPYMVIELLEGHDLGTELTEKVRLTIEEAVGYVMTACAPIAQAHAMGIVHRDLKPSNLFLARKKGGERVLKVLDFGIAKVLSEKNAKVTSSLFGLGTPHYMSPEQVRRASNVDGRADVWSLGVILYELLTGTVPFPEEPTAAIAAIAADPILPPRELRSDIPEELDRVIMRALEKDREKRWQTARDFAAALAPFAPEEELVAVSMSEALPRVSIPDATTWPPPPPDDVPPKKTGTTSGAMAAVVVPRASSTSWARWIVAGGAVALAAALVVWRVSAKPQPQVAVPSVATTPASPPPPPPAVTVEPPEVHTVAVAPPPVVESASPSTPKKGPTQTSRHAAATASAAPSASAAPAPAPTATSNPLML